MAKGEKGSINPALGHFHMGTFLMSNDNNLPAIIPDPVKIRVVVHPQGGDKALVEFPEQPELLIFTKYENMKNSVVMALHKYYESRGVTDMNADILWSVASAPVNAVDVIPDRSFRTETCKTCDFFLRTPGDSIHRKDVCRGWVPSSTAQNQYAYLANVDEGLPACSCYRRNPGGVMIWNPSSGEFIEESK